MSDEKVNLDFPQDLTYLLNTINIEKKKVITAAIEIGFKDLPTASLL